MRQSVVKALRELDAISVENKVYPGTPDVNYIGGWMELKWLRRWPKNCDESPVKIDHFTPQQRVWLKRRWRRGGAAWLLLQVRTDWLIFDGETAALIVGRVPRGKLFELCRQSWSGMDWRDFKSWLKSRARN
jgi:hypothetical protein